MIMKKHLSLNYIKDFLKINREQNHLVNRFKKSNEIQPNIMQEEALMSLKNLEIWREERISNFSNWNR